MVSLKKLKDREPKDEISSVRMKKSDKLFLNEQKISPSRLFDNALDDLKEQIRKETKSWN